MREEGETVMCEAMREMLEEATQEAVQEAVQGEREKLIINCLKKGHTCEAISDLNDIPIEEVKAVEEKFRAM